MNSIIDAGISIAVISVCTPLLLYWVVAVSRLMKRLDAGAQGPTGFWRLFNAIVMCGPVV